MHNFLVHSDESACRKSGRLWLEQVTSSGRTMPATRLRMICQIVSPIKWNGWNRKIHLPTFWSWNPVGTGSPSITLWGIMKPRLQDQMPNLCRTLLTGRAFSSDTSKVQSYIVRLISEKSVAEQNILPYKDSSDGRLYFMTLKEYYKGVGDNVKSTLTA